MIFRNLNLHHSQIIDLILLIYSVLTTDVCSIWRHCDDLCIRLYVLFVRGRTSLRTLKIAANTISQVRTISTMFINRFIFLERKIGNFLTPILGSGVKTGSIGLMVIKKTNCTFFVTDTRWALKKYFLNT